MTQIAVNSKWDVEAHVAYDQGYTQRVQLKKSENEIIHKNDLIYKNKLYRKQRTQEDGLRDTTSKRLPFNAKINAKNRESAQLWRTRKFEKTGATDFVRQETPQDFNEAIPEDEGEFDMLGEAPAEP